MNQVQVPALAGYRGCRGLVFFRLRDRVIPKGVLKGGFLYRIQATSADPPYAAAEWSVKSEGPWSRDFGGKWFERGDGRMEWRWN